MSPPPDGVFVSTPRIVGWTERTSRLYSFVCTLHHLIIIIVQTLSEDIELMKCLSNIICRVCKISIFSQLYIIQYMGLCVFSLPISFVMIERIYTLSYYHHQLGSMNYYPLFRVRSWNNGMRWMSFYMWFCIVFPLIFSDWLYLPHVFLIVI